jgi:hypothetical protein
MNWMAPAAIVGALYYGLAGLDHIGQKRETMSEYIAMISDGYAFLLISIFLAQPTSLIPVPFQALQATDNQRTGRVRNGPPVRRRCF